MGVMEPEPVLGARGGRQGWCGVGGCAGRLLPLAFVLGPKPMTENEGVMVCVCVCVYSHTALGVWWKGDLTSEPPMMSDNLTPHGTSSS